MVSAIDDSFDARLDQLNERIARACQNCGRDRRSVHLIGVSKTKPAADVVTAHEAGLQDFGENYLQEAIDKVESLAHLDLTWHYIGNIQSNKTKDIANNFDWVHTVDRVKVGKRLSDQRSKKRPLQILIQVNIDNDPNKGGCQGQDLPELMEALICLPNLELRGLMTILSQDSDPRASYESVAQLHLDACERLPAAAQQRWNTLSMGMSGDMEHAIAAGATHIRIGTALFGERT
ncbi:MAG: YggS family pyridoxal phosphate-dependent enzyme [Gammaproteobacteria bacterium]|jgi:pyridoxal phosphate enzyme (YggS family)